MQNIEELPKRLPIVFMPHLGCSIEYTEEFALFHLEYIDKVTKETVEFLKWYTSDVDEFVKDMGYTGLTAAVPVDNEKINRLAKLVGFNYIQDSEGEGTLFSIYRR